MKGKELKGNEKTIELLDGNHKIAIDFNAFEALEDIYGDMQTAFNKFTGKVKFTDIKNFLCAGVNACIENENAHYTPHKIGKLLDISKLAEYVEVLTDLLSNAMPKAENTATEGIEEEKN
jgi:hypothetical protein